MDSDGWHSFPPTLHLTEVWNTYLDYPGGHQVHLHTGCYYSQQKQQEDTWLSILNLVLVKELALEEYWKDWWRSAFDAENKQWNYIRWIKLLGIELPILGQREYCYKSEEQAKQGHERLALYLEQFMVERRLFDDIVEEMQAKRRALLEEVGLLHLAQHL